jgi:mono/diheme cytochrome c family protein
MVLIVLGLIGLAGFWIWATSSPEIAAIAPPEPASLDKALVEEGEMLARIGDCATCHTAPGGAPLAGGLGLPTPFGTIHSTNLTPDPDTGIGRWSEAAFVRAMREGLDRSGAHLYPAFPYDHFTKINDHDLSALYAYLMAQPPVRQDATPNQMQFPFGLRPLLAGWKLLFLDSSPWKPDPALTEEQNRGRYLVEGLAHCGACHSPRNMFGAVDASRPFGGGEAENWTVPPLGAASTAPVAWTNDAYLDYLFDGWEEHHSIAAGPMTAVSDHLYDATEDDVYAMAAYLSSLTPPPDPAANDAAIKAAEALDWADGETPGGANAPEGADLLAGEEIFFKTCTRCHKARIAETQPSSLALGAAVRAPDARNLLHVVRDGIKPPLGALARTMPGQEINLADADLIRLAAFVRWRFSDLPPWPDIAGDLASVKAGH